MDLSIQLRNHFRRSKCYCFPFRLELIQNHPSLWMRNVENCWQMFDTCNSQWPKALRNRDLEFNIWEGSLHSEARKKREKKSGIHRISHIYTMAYALEGNRILKTRCIVLFLGGWIMIHQQLWNTGCKVILIAFRKKFSVVACWIRCSARLKCANLDKESYDSR